MRKGRWTRDEEQFVRENYLQMSDEEMAERLSRKWRSVKWKRNELGYKRQEPGRRWSDEEVNILRYNLDKSDRELGEMLGRSMYAVHTKRIMMGFIKQNQNETKYRVKSNFFKNWSEEMAYILGLSFADAYIFKNKKKGYTFGISLIDEKLIRKINMTMESNYPIRKRTYGSNGIIYELRFYIKQIYDQLIEKGLSEKKSLNMRFPYVPDKFFWHFIRGYFDGDGSVRRIGRFLHLTIVSGSKVFAEAMQQQITKRGINFSLYTRTKNRKNTLYELQVRAITTRLFCEKMYENSTIFLERKHEIIQEYLNQKPNLTKCADCDIEIIKRHQKHIICRPCAKVRMNYRSKLAKRRTRARIFNLVDNKKFE